MTSVPRLYQLPVPAASAGLPVVAGQDRENGRQVKALVPANPAQRNQQHPDWTAAIDGRETRRGGLQAEEGDRRGQPRSPVSADSGSEAASGKLINFSRLSSMPFMVQVLGQESAGSRSRAVTPETSLSGHRDAALLGSDLYRRAGGEPEFLPESATFVRLAV